MEPKIIDCGKANIITLTWDTHRGKLPERGQLMVNATGAYFKVMELKGKEITLLQIQ